ncbi:PTS trehalose transporter subunit IIBC [Rodentibacter pneumotropicus]|uniref:PTS system trehalose-specific transporter subunit IIBC n=1 Tax=Rodentibacter pneumotropicus TaxID=758 RepID=A0A448MSE1_9PAST|nr:PTS trehalose transporter subunit IIBC [Rodentibacter pneumotropicus]NBH76130.1 PTS trehalose transporter subunit IIBC [Rodentibacter pneumotropicus]OOF64948.1 PTS trehalose transporter subunit IIBC [Rodentibacter pneumotropicus]THA03807.1 PTS trehalose transporter subunit IIBC [Rodentibacter pneumotropicus]THA04951.1 PTS trehalose transporter subunit IIBC [Rodentibacter pneumotropicus]THA14053.1 PTS trehalose transporter subunit IIBC [Rodentibacter pneumotropicus]
MAKQKIDPQNVDKLIVAIGGRENIATVTHCITRLRFVLNDESKVDAKAIETLPMVKANFSTGGQYQVVIGQEVSDYYKILLNKTGLASVDKEQVKVAARQNQKWYESLISHMADIFIPLLPALISGGLILGFRNVIGDIAMFDGKTLTQISPFWNSMHSFLWLIGEAIFHFLPVGICWSIARKMGTSPILGIVLGITLVSPQLMNSYALGSQLPEIWDFGLFGIEKVGYQAQVIPAIMAGLTLSYIERFMAKIVPDFLNLIIVPVVSIILAVFLAHSIIGPIGREIGNGVAFVVKHAMTGDFAPIGAALFGFLYAPLVVTGVHQTSLAIDMQMIQSIGGTPVWPIIALSNIAQASAVIGIIYVNKSAQSREVAIPAALSAYLGVTEPAMYGINLKYRFPMLCAMIGAAVAGLICGLSGVLAGSIGVGGLPGILSVQHQYWGVFGLAMLAAIVIPFILTTLVYKRKEKAGELA